METNAKIFIAGHTGLVGSAIIRELSKLGYSNIVTRTHVELDLTNQQQTQDFFDQEKPKYVFLAAAKVGGIQANNTYRAEFIYQNLMIQSNILHAAYLTGVKRLLFLGSSCIYPKEATQPISENALLTSPLELSNRPYALAKISGVEQCWAYNWQYGTQYLAAMPCNSYGPNDNFHPENSHVIPGLLRRIHEAKIQELKEVVIWGTGKPRREFIYSEDLAQACIFLMNLPQDQYDSFLNQAEPPLINIGMGQDISIAELAYLIAQVVNYQGQIIFDTTKLDGTFQKLLDVSKINALGWKAETNLEEGLAKAYQDFKANDLDDYR